jgi:hypothetical protein
MEFNFDNLFSTILSEATDAFGDGWMEIKDYAPAEFKKISVQLIEIAKNVALYNIDESQGYSQETGKILFEMQYISTQSVLVAVSTLIKITVQNILNRIIKVLKDTFSELVPIL